MALQTNGSVQRHHESRYLRGHHLCSRAKITALSKSKLCRGQLPAIVIEFRFQPCGACHPAHVAFVFFEVGTMLTSGFPSVGRIALPTAYLYYTRHLFGKPEANRLRNTHNVSNGHNTHIEIALTSTLTSYLFASVFSANCLG